MPNSMVSLLQQESLRHGGKLQMLSARRLADLETDIVKFAETVMIMEEKDFHEFDPALQKKVEVLGMTLWLPAIPRNLRILFELERTPHG